MPPQPQRHHLVPCIYVIFTLLPLSLNKQLLFGSLDCSINFDLFYFNSQERDLRERPTTCRTEYIRACAELTLSPIPVFDHLLALGSKCGSSSITAGGEGGEGEDSEKIFELDLRRYVRAQLVVYDVAAISMLSPTRAGF